MYSLPLLCSPLLFVAAVTATISATISSIFSCTGGTLYFTAHPADTLLYQNPSLFHDLYVYKCITNIILTSGDRGLIGNHSHSLEQGIETAYSWMGGLATDNQTWLASTVQFGEAGVRLSTHTAAANLQIAYLRLPDGGPAGSGYDANGGESLRKLYNGDIKSITTTDGNASYTLESLMELLTEILLESRATEVRVLDFKSGIPDEEDARSDHADHVVSARLVVDVMKGAKSKAKLRGYAGGFARNFNSNLNETDLDFKRKLTAFLKYAEYDQHMCKTYDGRLDHVQHNAEGKLFNDHDVLYAGEALEREYYVS